MLSEGLLTARELAGYLGISSATVLDWFEAGKLPGFKLCGHAVRFRLPEVEAWLEAQRGPARRRMSAVRTPSSESPEAARAG